MFLNSEILKKLTHSNAKFCLLPEWMVEGAQKSPPEIVKYSMTNPINEPITAQMKQVSAKDLLVVTW